MSLSTNYYKITEKCAIQYGKCSNCAGTIFYGVGDTIEELRGNKYYTKIGNRNGDVSCNDGDGTFPDPAVGK